MADENIEPDGTNWDEVIERWGYDPRLIRPTQPSNDPIALLIWCQSKKAHNLHIFGGGWSGDTETVPRIRE